MSRNHTKKQLNLQPKVSFKPRQLSPGISDFVENLNTVHPYLQFRAESKVLLIHTRRLEYGDEKS